MTIRLILGSLLAAAIAAQSATTSFTDEDFATVWSTVVPTNGPVTNQDGGGGGSQATSVVSSGGNPGTFLNILLNIGSSSKVVGTFSWRSDFTIDPTLVGGITNISYTFDSKRGASNNPGNAQAFGIAIRQNGIHYYNYNANSLTTWNTYSDSSLTAGELAVYGGEADEAAASGHQIPDFSATGAPITFGYMRLNSTVGGSAFVNGGMDNYSVTVDHNLVPEPTPNGLAMIGILTGCLFVRRRPER